jgi:hypothetical protein
MHFNEGGSSTSQERARAVNLLLHVEFALIETSDPPPHLNGPFDVLWPWSTRRAAALPYRVRGGCRGCRRCWSRRRVTRCLDFAAFTPGRILASALSTIEAGLVRSHLAVSGKAKAIAVIVPTTTTAIPTSTQPSSTDSPPSPRGLSVTALTRFAIYTIWLFLGRTDHW